MVPLDGPLAFPCQQTPRLSQTSMWDVIAESPARRQRFAVLAAELKPKYFGTG